MIDYLPEFCGVTEENQKRAIDAYRAGGPVPDIWWIDAGWYPCDNNSYLRLETGIRTPSISRTDSRPSERNATGGHPAAGVV